MANSASQDNDEIWAVFAEESRENLDQAETCLLKLETVPGDKSVIAALFRAVHTVKGSSRMMGLTALEALGHRAEDLVSLVRDGTRAMDERAVSLLLDVFDCLRQMLDQAIAQHSNPPAGEGDLLILQLSMLISEPGSPPAVPIQPLTAPPAQEAAESAAPEAEYPVIDEFAPVELIDLAMDPDSVRIFFEMADEEVRHLQAACQGFLLGEEDALQRGLASADALLYAAGQMGYRAVETELEGLFAGLQSAENAREAFDTRLPGCLAALEAVRAGCPFLSPDALLQLALDPAPAPERQTPPAILTDPLAAQHTENAFEEILDTIGALMGEQAVLHRAASRLEAADLLETFHALVRSASGSLEQVRAEFEPLLVQWMDQAGAISAAEKKIGAALTQLHETVRAMYQIPVQVILEPLRELAGQCALAAGKPLDVYIADQDVLLDRSTLDCLDRCLRYLVEAAIRSSLETAEERQMLGKAPRARLALSVQVQGADLQVSLGDDGCGCGANLDAGPVQSWLGEKQGLFTDRSGEEGSKFHLSLPVHQSVVDGMVVRCGSVFYIIAVSSIRRIVREDTSEESISSAEGHQTLLRLDGDLLPVAPLSERPPESLVPLLLVIEGSHKAFALQVDEVIGQQRATILPIPKNIPGVQHAAGCAILVDGEIGLVLDPNSVEAALLS
jgi:two-component system, chemotaxis family, sensor kinase CheA